MARRVECGCGRKGADVWAWVLGSDDEPVFVLCERCVRQPEKRQYLAGLVARHAFGPRATLHWRQDADGHEFAFAATPGDAEALTRFRLYPAL